MICEVSASTSFEVDTGEVAAGRWGDGVQVCESTSNRFIHQAASLLWNECGLHASLRCQAGDLPYVLVLTARKSGGKPSAASVATARVVCKALAVGLESNHLYRLD